VGDSDFVIRWMLVKAGFLRQIAKDGRLNKSRVAKGERGIWQRRYWEHLGMSGIKQDTRITSITTR
jgi:putative transposase